MVHGFFAACVLSLMATVSTVESRGWFETETYGRGPSTGHLKPWAVLTLAASWLRWAAPVVDIGREMNQPLRLSSGEMLYSDVRHIYGPLSPWVTMLALPHPRAVIKAWPAASSAAPNPRPRARSSTASSPM